MRLCCQLLVLLTPVLAEAEELTGRIVQIVDGDTVVMQTGQQRHTLNLAGLDAPERLQAFGQQSRSGLAQLLFNQQARAECRPRDKHGHRACTLRVQPPDCAQCGMTLDVGHAQVAAGMAWWDREPSQTEAQRSDYQNAEFMAQARRRGLWADTRPIPPWDWRKRWGLRDE